VTPSCDRIISVSSTRLGFFYRVETMKQCKKCEEVKSVEDFYSTATGTKAARCKECVKIGVRSNYRKNIDHYTQYEKDRMFLPHRVNARAEYIKTDAGKKSIYKSTKNYRGKNKKAYLAHSRVGHAINSGVLEKPDDCQVCKRYSPRIQAHHCDYSMPLDVMWLCSTCHAAWHR